MAQVAQMAQTSEKHCSMGISEGQDSGTNLAQLAQIQQTADQINDLHQQALDHARLAVSEAIEIGRLLSETKNSLSHGQWLPWIKENLRFGERQARNYMTIYANRQRVSDLDAPMREAVAVISGSISIIWNFHLIDKVKQKIKDSNSYLEAKYHSGDYMPDDAWNQLWDDQQASINGCYMLQRPFMKHILKKFDQPQIPDMKEIDRYQKELHELQNLIGIQRIHCQMLAGAILGSGGKKLEAHIKARYPEMAKGMRETKKIYRECQVIY